MALRPNSVSRFVTNEEAIMTMTWINEIDDDEDAPLLIGKHFEIKGNMALKHHKRVIKRAFDGIPQAQIIYVSGSGPNIFGHALVCFHTGLGFYAHVHRAGKHKPGVLCGYEAFEQYLRDEQKNVLETIDINDMNNVVAAREALAKSLTTKYLWGGVAHNCAQFAIDVVQAGGSKFQPNTCLPSVMKKSEYKKGDKDGKYKKIH